MSTDLLSRINNGDRRALARAITHIENNGSKGKELLDKIQFHQPNSQIIGITGPPGSGKSTLVDQLIRIYREKGLSVAILAVDPTSPFTGGAILGDRIRMLSRTSDEGVYIRSLASRGRLGGLSPYTYDVIALMQSAGFDKIIVETVGAGQSEIDIVRNADTTVVLSVPGLGDDIQVIKAGIMEIADIFVVNKSDLSGSQQLKTQINNMLDLVPLKSKWRPHIIETSALNNSGIIDLVKAIDDHFTYLQSDDNLIELRKSQLKFELINKFNLSMTSKLHNQTPNPVEVAVVKLVNGEFTISSALTYLESKINSNQSNN